MTDPEVRGTQVVHRGVHWYKADNGTISFYNTDGDEWVKWRRGGDSPPLPPEWSGSSGGGRPARPKWTSPWRLIPMIGAVIVVAFAVWQVTGSSSGQAGKEKAATADLLGKCLAQHGTLEGHPSYSAQGVSCDSSTASVKVVAVVPSTPGSPLCPVGTTGFEIPYVGVRYPHVLCLQDIQTER